jgi:isopenicillin N synthase-like dioxygenase
MASLLKEQRSDGATSGRLDTVPTVDIGPFLAGSQSDRAEVVSEVRRACEDIGFFLICGHGVPGALVERIRTVSNAFFDLPIEEKLKSRTDSAIVGASGFEVMGKAALARSLGKESPPDYREGYKIGVLSIPDHDPYYQSEEARKYFPPNVWPARPTDFRRIYEDYYRVMERLSADIMRIFALALDLDEHFFVDKMDKPVNKLTAIRYPAQTVPPGKGQLRAGEHTDYGTLTILLAEDKPGGLQVKLRNGAWLDVHPPNGTFVINIGDLMMRWTNDHWISNLHRVVNPPREFSEIPRLSIVFFQKPNYDAEIKCIEKYAGTHSPAKYAAIMAGDHWYEKNAKSRPPAKAAPVAMPP